ncbi:MAG: NTP transferase domain-containing protein [Proteobacteria bacterium]|nr:NTP transferase domain-containing protein [Pseudomonadota bacterium]MCP4917635.1 NTP transferase domain-containing protein [Pseudomonadota bacterium]
MQVIILCGGYGTRMGSVTGTLPKPMVDVAGRPLLWHVMRCFADRGATRFVLCLGYLGDVVQTWLEQTPLPWDVEAVDTGRDTLTGGRLLGVRERLEGRSAFVTYGDGVADVDLPGLLAHHRREGRHATVTALRPRSRFGVLDLNGGAVTRFREKPLLDQYVSGGFFVFEPPAFDALRPDEMLEQGALGRLADANQLSAWRHEGLWISVDTPRDLAEINRLADGGAPWLASS